MESPRKKKAGTGEKLGFQRSAEDRASREREMGASAGTLSSFEGPIDQSPFYKNLLRLGTESTNRAYDAALSGVRRRAAQSGFDPTQPFTQAGEAGVDIERAGALSRLPGESYLAATEPAFTAAGIRSGRAAQYGGESGQYFQTAAELERQRRQSSGFWKSLSKLALIGGGAALAPFTGGASLGVSQAAASAY